MKFKSMTSIISIVLIVAFSIFAAGCVETGPSDEETTTPTPTATVTVTATETATQTPTIEPTATAEPKEYLIRIDNYMFIPVGDKVINVGDTVKWRNFEDTKQSRYLINENGIWDEEQYLPYMRSVSYTFNETGVYTFYLKGRESKKLNITVV